MKIYIDYLFVINFLFDFIILSSLSTLLKRNIKIYRIVLGSIFGGLSIIILFLNISSVLFFILKMFLGLMMVIITFNFKNIKYTFNNFINLLVISIILGGMLYLINLNSTDFYFINSNKYINIIFLLVVSVLILFVYVKMNKKYQTTFNNYYEVDLFVKNKKYRLNGFVDTGNKLLDPYFNKPIILTSNKNIKFENVFYVPYKSLNSNGLLECMMIDKIKIKGIGHRNKIILGKSNDKFNIEGIDIILNERMIE